MNQKTIPKSEINPRNMDRYEEEQRYLLHLAGAAPGDRSHQGPVDQLDYVAIYTPPANLTIPICSPCLIWRHSLSSGYGTTTISPNGKSQRAHRTAYDMSRERPAGDLMVLHICNRRTCIQPAHLYAATTKENAQDGKDRYQDEGAYPGKESLGLWNRDTLRVDEGMKYYWDEPETLTPPLFEANDREHAHTYTIHVGETQLCSICFAMNSPDGAIFGSTLREEARYRGRYRAELETFFIGRKPGDLPLNIIPSAVVR